MNAAEDLLQTTSAVSLTVAAVSRQARTSPATFYVYFDGIPDMVYELALAATDDLGEVLDILARWRDHLSAADGATQFVETFRHHWAKHRTILNIRNLEADRGDGRFLQMRAEAGRRIINELAMLIQSGPVGRTLHPREAVARATVVYAAIERLAATEALYPQTLERPSSEEMTAAQVAVLIGLIAPGQSPSA